MINLQEILKGEYRYDTKKVLSAIIEDLELRSRYLRTINHRARVNEVNSIIKEIEVAREILK